MSSLFCSEFYTADAASACLFLPAVDTLNPARLGTQQLEQMLASLPTWNEGENQLIFTFASSGNTFCEVHNYMFRCGPVYGTLYLHRILLFLDPGTDLYYVSKSGSDAENTLKNKKITYKSNKN